MHRYRVVGRHGAQSREVNRYISVLGGGHHYRHDWIEARCAILAISSGTPWGTCSRIFCLGLGMPTAVIPDSHGRHSQDQKPKPPAAFHRPDSHLFFGNGFPGNRFGQVHGFQMGHSRTPEELNFPKFGKYPERDFTLTAAPGGDKETPKTVLHH